jgi:bifunctional UDP-N-acetylglucosamine pyrophosphorylase/glucosamine-1-phosphate N-acetyltransferase
MSGTNTLIVLAAGEGKRMKSALPKVLHPLLGRTLLGHVLAAASAGLGPQRTAVVVGQGADAVREHLVTIAPEAVPVLQAEQRGTGHAVRTVLDELGELAGTVVVLNGDIPMLRSETLAALLATHQADGASATLLTAEVDRPDGLGRIVRSPGGGVAAIVEERDATPEQRAIREINVGAYVFEATALRELLGKLSSHNDQGEEYLTDIVGLLVAAGLPVSGYRVEDVTEAYGCNDRAELATLRALMRDRINRAWMRDGVTIIDPATTWIDVTVTLARDVAIEPNCQLRGTTAVDTGALVGPDSTLVDVLVGEAATVVRAHATSAEIGPGASVGPFAYLRPGTRLGRKSKVGTFVETKAADIGDAAKVPHLSYVGDATIGEGANIGAATVFVNYDGVHKNRSVIGKYAFVGCDSMVVAPVTVGDGAYTAAGSVIVNDVPSGAMGVARGRQRNVEGWVVRRRAGTKSAAAAEQALRQQATGHGTAPPGSEQLHDVGRPDGEA